MAIFRGTGGSGSSSDSTIVDAVTAQATIATTKAGEASTSATTATTKASEASTSATTATTKADEANTAKNTAESARDLAQTYKNTALQAASTAGSHANAAEASAQTANSSAVQTVAGSNTQVVGVYNNIANVNTVAGVNTDVTTVAGISSDVTTVAADASDIGTVSTNIANVNNVGNNIANVNAVHGNASNINTVAADGTDIGTVSSNIANVNTVAGISSNVTTVAGLESKMDTVIADASDIGAVAGNIGDVTTVAGINSDVDTVAGIAAKVTTVADNISDVQNADTNATNAASSASDASASATSASNSATTATTKATEASNSATAASNSATTATTKASQAAGSATTAGTSASTATTKASEASASATTATTKAGEAASSASAASGSATTAVTKASEASVSAASAATSATNSSNAASTWNNFYNSYLGTSDAQPSVDVLGNAIVAGALYYDTGAGSNTVGLYVYNGSSWVYSTNYNNVTAPYILAQDLNANGKKIISAGNVGIGTASPTVKLDVETQATGNVASFTGAHPSRNLLITNYTSGGDGSSYAINANSGFGEIKLQTVSNDRIKVANNGDISFYEDTGTTPKFFWDASAERLGIGTTSPSEALEVNGTVKADTHFTSSDTNATLSTSGNGGTVRLRPNGIFSENGQVIVNTSGNVGIGTSSPAQKLDVNGNIRVQGTYPKIEFVDTNSNPDFTLIGGNGAFQFYDETNSTERMRIDSSGNLLVGKTSTAFGTAGSVSYATGLLTATVDGNACVQLNRLTSDGVIQTFGKDGTTVGSISTVNGDMYLGTANVNLRFTDSANDIRPVNSSGVNLDNTVDLGASATRFKDLYLSGGVHLGGTTAANKLDDYEEGTWTPTLYGSTSGSVAFTVSGNKYTKVGNLVHFVAYLTNIQASSHNAVGELRIGGLPFVTNTHCAIPHTSYTNCFNFDETDMPVGGYISSGSSFISLRRGSHTTAIDATNFNAVNNQRMMISGTYQTNA